MTGAALVKWDALERRRRREAGAGVDARLSMAGAAVVGAAGLWWIGRSVDPAEARGWWTVLVMAATAGVIMGGPWRLYWRPDAALLARLPIGGAALYRLALARSLRVAAWLALPLAVAAVGVMASEWFAPPPAPPATSDGQPILFQHVFVQLDWQAAAVTWGRMIAVAWIGLLTSALAAPAAATAAGALVASDSAQRAVASMAGEFAGPRVIWLSILPAGVGFAAGWAVYRIAPWAAGGHIDEGTAIAAAALVGGAILLCLAGATVAARWLPAATREVAALDRVQLAKVETTRAVGVEAAWGRVACGATGSAPAIYRKDVALARRRFPAYYLLAGLAQITAWLVAALADSPRRDRVVIAIVASLAAYTVVFARRLIRPPIEEPRLLRTLPIAPAAAARAKTAYAIWRAVVPLGLASVVAIARSPAPLRLGAVIAAIVLATAGAAAVACRPQER